MSLQAHFFLALRADVLLLDVNPLGELLLGSGEFKHLKVPPVVIGWMFKVNNWKIV